MQDLRMLNIFALPTCLKVLLPRLVFTACLFFTLTALLSCIKLVFIPLATLHDTVKKLVWHIYAEIGKVFSLVKGAWISEWYNTWLRTSECYALGHKFKPQ